MLLPKSYAGSLQVALSTQTTTHTAQQPLNGLRTALKKISRSVNAAFSAVPVAKFEQQTAAAAVSANKAAKAQAKLASGTTKAAKAAKRSVAEFDELDRLQASLAESAGAAAASTTRKSSSAATIKAADAEPPQLSPPALLNQQLQNFWATLQAVLAPAAALWDAAWQQMKTAALTVWQDLLGGVQLTWAEYGQPIAQSAALALENLQGIFTTLWQNVLQPILTNLMQILSTLWSSHLKPCGTTFFCWWQALPTACWICGTTYWPRWPSGSSPRSAPRLLRYSTPLRTLLAWPLGLLRMPSIWPLLCCAG